MDTEPGAHHSATDKPEWFEATSTFARPDRRKAVWQIINTLVPFTTLWVVMLVLVRQGYSYWAILGLALLAGPLLVRIFILFHDCCHGSFFASKRANRVLGYITGILTFTPFEDWQRSHGIHHATAGDLDRRGVGDIWTMTVEEFRTASLSKRMAYRFFRNPFALFGPIAVVLFLVVNRFSPKDSKRLQHRSVLYTNVALVGLIGLATATIGLRHYLLVQLPIIIIAGVIGVWLFYVQHQFQGVYWARHDEWDPMKLAMEGSSYYKLPKILQWFTGNIGLHHIHHIRPRIPNYNLQAAYDAIPALQTVKPLSFGKSLESLGMNLYDEQRKQMVGFRALSGYAP